MKKPKHVPTFSLELITPAAARKWLVDNASHQRPISRFTINRYKAEMADGKWILTHQGIGFDTQGRLIDGQHRLTAIAEADVPVWCMVARGVDPEAFDRLDKGKTRSLSDLLGIRGERHTTIASSVLFLLHRWDPTTGKCTHTNGAKSNTEAWESYRRISTHPEWSTIRICIDKATSKKDGYDGAGCSGPSLWAAVMAIATLGVGDRADEFFTPTASGVGLDSMDPRLTLRNRLLANRASRQKMTRTVELEAIIRAWNAWYDGRKLSKIQCELTIDGDKVPKMRGCEHVDLGLFGGGA